LISRGPIFQVIKTRTRRIHGESAENRLETTPGRPIEMTQ